jgi:hypothetical protein
MPANRPGYRAPSLGFTKGELQAFAQAGIRDRVREIERELERIRRSFPGLLRLGAGPIVLLAAEARTDGQTWAPLPEPPKAKQAAAIKKSWTPARRQQQARRIKKRLPQMQAARHRKQLERQGKKPNGRVPTPVWQEMRAALLAAPEQRLTTAEIRQALGRTDKAVTVAIANSAQQHPEVFKRVETGVYALTAAGKKVEPTTATE